MGNKIQIARQWGQQWTKAEKKLRGHLRNRPQQIEKDGQCDKHPKQSGYAVPRFKKQVVFRQPEITFQSLEESIKREEESFTGHKANFKKRSDVRDQPLTSILATGRESYTVLSTKKLSLSQKELLLNAGTAFVEYNAIKIEFVDFEIDDNYNNLIFTSQNAVRAFLKKQSKSTSPTGEGQGARAFCVGEKTKSILEENGLKVIKKAQNALELGKIIAKEHKNESFLFFCGNKKREELPLILLENDIPVREIEVYRTILNPQTFDRIFDGLLFFSPSAVESYISCNEMKNTMAFCIGSTTGKEAKKHTDHIIIANTPTIENTLVQVVKYFKNDKL